MRRQIENGPENGLESGPLERSAESGFCARASAPGATPEEEHTAEGLVAGMIENEAWAWKEFQRRYDRLIHRCITKVTRRFGRIGQDDVRDIYASLYLSLVAQNKRKLRTFDPRRGNRFSSWIGLLAINCAYDYLRSLRREPLAGSLAEAAELACELPDPYEKAAFKQHAKLATRVLDGFSEKDQAFAALYFGEELDPAEIAVRMRISVKTVYSKKHKIQSRLESVLATGATGMMEAGQAFA